MSGWIIEPREPLIVRDGRPFDPQPGVVATTLPFPFPSTIAGAARSSAGSENGMFTVAEEKLSALLSLQVRGPLLVELPDGDDSQEHLLVPAPGDALLLEGDGPLRCKQLVPVIPFDKTAVCPIEVPGGKTLAPVGQEEYEAEKPAGEIPAFWYWDRLAQWLLDPAEINHDLSRDTLGIQALPQDQRVHVSMEADSRVAREGALFATRGLEFTSPVISETRTSPSRFRRLALWFDIDECDHYAIREQLAALGGERRLMRWQKSTLELKALESLRDDLSAKIGQAGACRLLLLTPAYFEQGYFPAIKKCGHEGIVPELHAALVQRPQVVSGWDLQKKEAKPTRRLAPAGSVFFLTFPESSDPQAIAAWVQHYWLTCVSDDDQASKDGFGLAVLGTWDGNPKPIKLKGA